MPDSRTGTAIKRARERKRWTQRQLAGALGVNVKTVDNWENGRTHPRNSVGALEEVLGISLSDEAAAPALAAEDEWEREVLGDPYLPDDDKAWLITDHRRVKRAASERRRARRAAAEDDAARSGRSRIPGA
jgi:transcriptional regulator with XRE-family HTH domain